MICRGWRATSELMSGRTGIPPTAGFSSPLTASMASRFPPQPNDEAGNGIPLPFGIVFIERFRIWMPTTATIGFGSQNQTIKLFHRPPVFHKPVRQVIKQGGVRGQLARTTEIIRITRHSPAKMPGPDTIDQYSGSQWIFFVHDPFGEGQTTLPFALRKRPDFHVSQRFRGA